MFKRNCYIIYIYLNFSYFCVLKPMCLVRYKQELFSSATYIISFCWNRTKNKDFLNASFSTLSLSFQNIPKTKRYLLLLYFESNPNVRLESKEKQEIKFFRSNSFCDAPPIHTHLFSPSHKQYKMCIKWFCTCVINQITNIN